jgi:hypothetical protein
MHVLKTCLLREVSAYLINLICVGERSKTSKYCRGAVNHSVPGQSCFLALECASCPRLSQHPQNWACERGTRRSHACNLRTCKLHPKLFNINLHNVTHSLISRNPRERMFEVQISLLIVTFLSLTS